MVGIVAIAGLAVVVFFATVGLALGCDESCNKNLVPQAREPGWWHSADAWQWHGQWIVALAALLFAITAVVLIRVRKECSASFAATMTTGCVVAWAAIVLS